ncbi:MAG: glycogen-binding domain-containing protein, partial [Gemmatimonadales bacterium]
IERPRVSASVWLNGRVSGTYTSSAAASASLRYFVTPTVALEAAGGSYLRDPFQGLPRAGFITAAVRLFQAPRELLPTVSTRPRPRPGPPPLIAQRRGGGDTVVVRFRMDARRSLAIAGDWNAWAPVPLRPLGDDIWEAVLVLPRGTYHFNLLVDEEEWVVPGGVAVISDGLGGLVAVLTVL